MENLYDMYLTYFRPVLDIFLLSFIIYQIYKILLQNKVLPVIKGIVAILTLYAFAFMLRLETMLWLLNKLANGFIIIMAIVFQQEIKSFFLKVGQSRMFSGRRRIIGTEVETIISAAQILSTMKRGCLLVFERQANLRNFIDSGTVINADISSSLIITIFGKDTALHDGAAIISGKKIVSAGCLLPLSEQKGIRKSFGTRHRAALGITEKTDAVVLVVSEETGAVSLAYNSNLYYNLPEEELKSRLNSLVVLGNPELADEEADNE